jgi:hypothetical protein
MADDSKVAWLNWLAITTIIFSACATLSTFKGGGFSTKSMLAQTEASNRWAYFQSKSVKQHGYELHKDMLALELMNMSGAQADSCRAVLADYDKEIARYDKEKQEAAANAQSLEQAKTEYQKDSAAFGLAVVYLQVAIMFSALAALLKKKYVWVLGMVVGSVGLVNFCNAIWHVVW